MSVSDRIVELRNNQRLSQKELAQRLKIDRSVLSRIEGGTRPIRDDELKLFADYFNVSADYLLERATPRAHPLSAEQRKVLSVFDALSEESKILFLGMLNSLRVLHVKTKQKTAGVVQNNSGGTNYIATGGNNDYTIVVQ